MTEQEAIEELSGMYRICVVDSLNGKIEAENKNNAIDMAIEALEKQIPKKPIVNLWDEWCECPVCNGIVYFQDAKCDYCPDCGQKIDWSENRNISTKGREKNGK